MARAHKRDIILYCQLPVLFYLIVINNHIILVYNAPVTFGCRCCREMHVTLTNESTQHTVPASEGASQVNGVTMCDNLGQDSPTRQKVEKIPNGCHGYIVTSLCLLACSEP